MLHTYKVHFNFLSVFRVLQVLNEYYYCIRLFSLNLDSTEKDNFSCKFKVTKILNELELN